jgi:hypothetical protein
MSCCHLSSRKTFLLFLIPWFIVGCSFHYDLGQELEKQERWAEAAIEYRIAAVENPDDEDMSAALKRMNVLVAQENFESYQQYLQQKEFHKAYRRLETALIQNPELTQAREEMAQWWHLLITGKVELEFDRLSSNLRLAEEMILQVHFNTPNGKLLSGNISSETGIFFLEDVVYRTQVKQLAEYTINAIGLKIKRKSSLGYVSNEFKKFVNFKEISPLEVSGKINDNFLNIPQNVLDHRPVLISDREALVTWQPPRLVSYELRFDGDTIKVISASKRGEFAPAVLYLNKSDLRANLDFGVSQLKMDAAGRKWSIRRKTYRTAEDDYYYGLSSNLSLNRYFYYDRVFRFIQ